MAPPLSLETKRRVPALFQESLREQASTLLAEQCGNKLPFCGDADEFKLERIRFAALKLSAGDMTNLRNAIELAKQDWRDLLMAAGFGNDPGAHEKWFPKETFE